MTRTYHWLVTLQWTDGAGVLKVRTGHGAVELGGAAICFVLEPNEVTAG